METGGIYHHRLLRHGQILALTPPSQALVAGHGAGRFASTVIRWAPGCPNIVVPVSAVERHLLSSHLIGNSRYENCPGIKLPTWHRDPFALLTAGSPGFGLAGHLAFSCYLQTTAGSLYLKTVQNTNDKLISGCFSADINDRLAATKESLAAAQIQQLGSCAAQNSRG